MRSRLLAAAALVALWPLCADAQTTRPITDKFDFDSATPTACVLDPAPTSGPGRLTTSGSSTTVTAVSGTPFANVVAGAQLVMSTGLATFTRTIMVRGSSSSVTVDSAVDLSATASFSYRNITCGTGAESGWFNVSDLQPKRTWTLNVDQISLASGSLAAVLWCRPALAGVTPTQVYPETTPPAGQCGTGLFTTTAACTITDNDILFSQCRWLITLTDDAGDTGANQEKVTVVVTGSK